jgi:hypothetical protein
MYLCHVGMLANYASVAKALRDPSEANIRRFTDAMKRHVNQDATGNHDKFGIGGYTEWEVNGDNSRELLECIRQTMSQRWDDLAYREILTADIPQRLSYELAEASGSQTIFESDPAEEIASGALRGHELAGFASGRKDPTLVLALRNYYVGDEYRQAGVGNRILDEVRRLSKRKRLDKVDMSRINSTIARKLGF